LIFRVQTNGWKLKKKTRPGGEQTPPFFIKRKQPGFSRPRNLLAHAQEVVGTCKIQITIDCLTFIQTTSLQELMEKLKMPSDAEFMKTAIADLNNSSVSLEERQRALQELLVLVEPIDNANGNVNHVYVC